jgi:hypothetical protein
MVDQLRFADLGHLNSLRQVVQRLTHSYAVLLDQVSVAVQDAQPRFEQSPVREFMPLLV